MLLFFLPGPRWAKRRPRRRGTPGCWTPSTKSGTRSSGRTWRGSRPASGCTTRSTATRPSRSSSRSASSTEQSKRFGPKLSLRRDLKWRRSLVSSTHRWRHSWSRIWALYPSLIFSDATLNSSWLYLIGKTVCFEVCCNNGSEWFWNIIERTERQLSFFRWSTKDWFPTEILLRLPVEARRPWTWRGTWTWPSCSSSVCESWPPRKAPPCPGSRTASEISTLCRFVDWGSNGRHKKVLTPKVLNF